MKKKHLDARIDIRLSAADKEYIIKQSTEKGFKSVNSYVLSKLTKRRKK